jgi:acetyl/propionyl-CoA carboxylase alpha subunit
VLADKHGNVVYLFERECSIQRRHQKLVEEAPSAILSPELRQKMGESAADVARACQYVGAGTVEFLLDDQLNYYFLEMNTRLQVEHPVTELITGLDLVKQQILVARGEKLAFTQADLSINGHAIELRVCAEDPLNNFLPSIGNLQTYLPPRGIGIRVDDGYREGMDIPIYYDNMLAKLITYGANRQEAIERMIRAIDEFRLTGIASTLAFGKFVMQHPNFINGNFDTNFIKHYFLPESLVAENTDEARAAALIGAYLLQNKPTATSITETAKPSSKWRNRR